MFKSTNRFNKRSNKRSNQSFAKKKNANTDKVVSEMKQNYSLKKSYNKSYSQMQKLKIIPLGGQEEVGRNMTVFEYGNDIVLVDMGNQFPEEDMPGVDYIIPNIDYLKGKEKRIRAVVFTHGHLDHIGAAPILLEKLGYPPVVGKDLTIALIKSRLEDFNKGSSKRLKTIRVDSFQEAMRFGQFRLKFFEVEHSIMDSMGVALMTPSGTAVHMGDWTLGTGKDSLNYRHLSKLPKPIILMAESLGATKRGSMVKEEEMLGNLQGVIDNASGRIIVGTFSSQIKRVKDILEYAKKVGKKVALDGYSMKMNIEVAKKLGYIKVDNKTLIDMEKVGDYPDHKIVVVCTGAQGESRAVLSRIVNNEHRFIRLKKSDTVIFSSSVIPGNERTIQRLKDNIYRKCDNVIHSEIMDIHVSGHNNIESIQELVRQVRPDYVLPVYANHYFLKEAKKVIKEIGFQDKNIFVLDNGHIIEFEKNKRPQIAKQKADTSYVFVDGSGIGDIGEVVLRDRQMLSEDGMFVIVANVDKKTKRLVGDIQVTSRGFIYVKENFDLVNATKGVVKKVISQKKPKKTKSDWNDMNNEIKKSVGTYLFKKTERRPMVLPVVIRV